MFSHQLTKYHTINHSPSRPHLLFKNINHPIQIILLHPDHRNFIFKNIIMSKLTHIIIIINLIVLIIVTKTFENEAKNEQCSDNTYHQSLGNNHIVTKTLLNTKLKMNNVEITFIKNPLRIILNSIPNGTDMPTENFRLITLKTT